MDEPDSDYAPPMVYNEPLPPPPQQNFSSIASRMSRDKFADYPLPMEMTTRSLRVDGNFAPPGLDFSPPSVDAPRDMGGDNVHPERWQRDLGFRHDPRDPEPLKDIGRYTEVDAPRSRVLDEDYRQREEEYRRKKEEDGYGRREEEFGRKQDSEYEMKKTEELRRGEDSYARREEKYSIREEEKYGRREDDKYERREEETYRRREEEKYGNREEDYERKEEEEYRTRREERRKEEMYRKESGYDRKDSSYPRKDEDFDRRRSDSFDRRLGSGFDSRRRDNYDYRNEPLRTLRAKEYDPSYPTKEPGSDFYAPKQEYRSFSRRTSMDPLYESKEDYMQKIESRRERFDRGNREPIVKLVQSAEEVERLAKQRELSAKLFTNSPKLVLLSPSPHDVAIRAPDTRAPPPPFTVQGSETVPSTQPTEATTSESAYKAPEMTTSVPVFPAAATAAPQVPAPITTTPTPATAPQSSAPTPTPPPMPKITTVPVTDMDINVSYEADDDYYDDYYGGEEEFDGFAVTYTPGSKVVSTPPRQKQAHALPRTPFGDSTPHGRLIFNCVPSDTDDERVEEMHDLEIVDYSELPSATTFVPTAPKEKVSRSETPINKQVTIAAAPIRQVDQQTKSDPSATTDKKDVPRKEETKEPQKMPKSGKIISLVSSNMPSKSASKVQPVKTNISRLGEGVTGLIVNHFFLRYSYISYDTILFIGLYFSFPQSVQIMMFTNGGKS